MVNQETAQKYLRAGLSVLPADKIRKCPNLPEWKTFQKQQPTENQIHAWFSNRQTALCLVCGKVSGNLEVIDFDNHGELFSKWKESIPVELLSKLVIEQTQSGGYHVAYRYQDAVCSSFKLAEGKRDGKLTTLIETRGKGGLILCAPGDGYTLVQGDYTALPVLTKKERETLLWVAYRLDERPHDPEPERLPDGGAADTVCGNDFTDRPGDDFNARGDVRSVLIKHGWTSLGVQPDGNEYWRRPGKTEGNSATLKDGVFYMFSSNAAPFEPNRGYNFFTVYALLEHNGDFGKAAAELLKQGYGKAADDNYGVDLSALLGEPPKAESKPEPILVSPSGMPLITPEMEKLMEADDESARETLIESLPFPEELYQFPGLVGDVMNATLKYASKPNRPLALSGALALMSYLAARKVKSPSGLRPNIYILALAGSGCGKERPRDINQLILESVQLDDGLLDKAASGEGIEDMLAVKPALLWQCDEFYSTLHDMLKEKKEGKDTTMEYLLKLYTNAHKNLKTRVKAGKPGQKIYFPHLTIYATTTPAGFFEHLNERFLNDGMYARLNVMIAEASMRGTLPVEPVIDPEIIEKARRWAQFIPPGSGNIDFRALPVPYTADAEKLAKELYEKQEDESEKARRNEVPEWQKSVWNRACEIALRYALIYACSIAERPENTVITAEAIRWAERFIWWEIRNKFFLTERHYFRTDFEKVSESVMEVMRQWHRKNGLSTPMPGWKFNRKTSHLPPNVLKAVIESLEKQKRLVQTSWRKGMIYYLPTASGKIDPEKSMKHSGKIN